VTSDETARTPTRRAPRVLVVALLVVLAAIAAALGSQLLASTSSTVTSTAAPWTSVAAPWSSAAAPSIDAPRRQHHGALGEADGFVPDGTTVFDDEVPGVAHLDPALLDALRRAATEAAADGVELQVNSGWRSPAYQEQLLRAAVAEYGSEEEAARWVATPETSLHVSGEAVDIGPSEAAAWLSEHGADHGLCPIYDNEPWHYELRPEAVADGCPARYADPTEDPRMQG
jgi:D-alanyl-D-alanine carboxypeptidase